MNKRKSHPYMDVWLEVDDKNKKVKYRVDPTWLENTSDENLKTKLDKLTTVVAEYRRDGYAISKFLKERKRTRE